MAPIRRYLRITKYSVLECRIYLDNPALAESWLLNARNPVLPRVIEAVRPLVLPKLREENERGKAKGSKKKGVKDVVVEEDFEVSIFLTETSARHTILYKQKLFREPRRQGIQSNSHRLMGATNDTAIEVEDTAPTLLREESEEGASGLAGIPVAHIQESPDEDESLFVAEEAQKAGPRRSKRSRAPRTTEETELEESSSPEHISKRQRNEVEGTEEGMTDDKKKMAVDTSYDGFSIYGRVLCLVVKRKERKGKGPSSATVVSGGQAMMEDWIASTQMPALPVED